MPKFNKGDKVVPFRDMALGKEYSMFKGHKKDVVTIEMKELADTCEFLTIAFADDTTGYYVEEDGTKWHWVDEMFYGLYIEGENDENI